MFEKLRRPGRSHKEKGFKKLFSYFIFGAICLVFVFLAPMGTKLIGEGVLAYVGSEPIRAGEVKVVEDNLKRQYKSRLEQVSEEELSKIQKEIRKRALRHLIDVYLTTQASQKDGFRLSDQELRSEIRSFSVFQEDGRFLYSRYKNFLKSQRLSPSRFEKRVRKFKFIENWRKLFKKAVISNQLEKEKKDHRYRYKVDFRYILFNAGDIEEEFLESLVKSKNLKKISIFLKKKNLIWQKTGLFSLFSAFGVPIAQNENVMGSLIHHLPSRGLIPKLIRQADKIYIVDVTSFKQAKISPKEQKIEDLLNQNFDKSVRLLDTWMNFQRQKIEVKLSVEI